MLEFNYIDELSPAQLLGTRVFLRVDFNLPMENGIISDDFRMKAALPTIHYLINAGARLIVCSHLGQPKGVDPKLTLAPMSKRLSELLGKPVTQASDCIGAEVEALIAGMQNGDVVMLENVRFHPEETKNDPEFSKKLASLATLCIQDAFGASHRAHASTAGIGDYIPCYAGFLMRKEIQFLYSTLFNPKTPFLAIIGGSKVSSKIGILKHLLGKVDTLFIGGGMAFTFMKAQGFSIGKSLCENDKLEEAAQFLEQAKQSKTKVILPIDQVVVSEFNNNSPSTIVPMTEIPSDKLGVDAGPASVALLKQSIQTSKTILWNGPLGVFEMDNFAKGTNAVAQLLSENTDAITIIGGGDSAAAVTKAGLYDKMTHVSTGGGAALEFLEGRVLPGLVIVEKNRVIRGR